MINIENYIERIPFDTCWIWIKAKNPKGYGKVGVNGKNRLAHRVSYSQTFGPIPDKMLVLHKCDNPSCVNPDHLFIGNNQDNMTDMSKKGRSNSKLTSKQVQEIRNHRQNGLSLSSIANKFSITLENVYYITKNKTWKHTQ